MTIEEKNTVCLILLALAIIVGGLNSIGTTLKIKSLKHRIQAIEQAKTK